MTTTWLSSLCIASIAVSILYKITKFANFSRSQSFSCGSLFCKQTSLQPSAYTDAVCSLLIGHSKRLHLMYVQLVIFHFFYLHPFPLSFFSWGEGVISIHLGHKRRTQEHSYWRGGSLNTARATSLNFPVYYCILIGNTMHGEKFYCIVKV